MISKFRKLIMVLLDLLLINASLYLAFMLRFDWRLPANVKSAYISLIVGISIIRLIAFFIFGLYQWTFRYTSFHDAISIWKAITTGTLTFIVIVFMKQYGYIGRSIPLIDYFLCLFFIASSRFLPRLIMEFKKPLLLKKPKKVLIVGAGAGGELVARQLIRAKELYQPVGFIDDDIKKKNLRIHGIKVLGTSQLIPTFVKRYMIEEIIIAIPSATGKVIREIISRCQKINISYKIIPGLQKILLGQISISDIKKVEPEDLLGRETIQINTDEIKGYLFQKRILITGAGGSIGSELCRQVANFEPAGLILYDHNENDIYFLERELEKKYPSLKFQIVIGDIKDLDLLMYAFNKYKPQVVFHAAAHKHVPLMECCPWEAVKNNIIATRNIMETANRHHVEKFVLISTDKAVNPTSVMGASKRIAEMLIQAQPRHRRTKFMAVRFGNVIGSRGSVIPLFEKQIAEGGPLTVTHPEAKRFFMSGKEAAQLVMQAGAIGKGGEIFILDMGDPIKIVDLARNMVILSGLEPDKDISIEFIGLRPGEKLYEETLLNVEIDKVTKHDKIFITQSDNVNPAKLYKDIKELEKLANTIQKDRIIKKMEEMIPFYTPDNRKSTRTI